MSISAGYTDQRIRELVYTYERLPHGTKAQWLSEQGISHHVFRRWRGAVFDGDIDSGLIPREGGKMTAPHQRRRLANSDPEAENERLRKRVEELEATNEALGKAIGLLHQLNEQEPDSDPEEPPKKNKPS